MKQVTLYSAHKQQVISYDMQYVQQYHYPYAWDILSVRNSDTILDKQEVEVKHLPIERFCWADGRGGYTREVFAAFDEELRELVGISLERFERDVQTATDRRVKRDYTQLLAVKDDHQALISLSLWGRLAWAIKKVWR